METSVLRVRRVEIVDSRRPAAGLPSACLRVLTGWRVRASSCSTRWGNPACRWRSIPTPQPTGASFTEKDDMPRLVLELSNNEVSIKEVDPETAGEIRRVRWQRVPGS